MTVLWAVLFVLACSGCLLFWQQDRKHMQAVDRMLDDLLDGTGVSECDLREGAVSALATKVKRVQEKVDLSIASAEEERESVKQLVSNMSHQLKTPLAGLMMYREMHEDESLDILTRRRFLARMKGQTEKLDWILEALFKMVELEQGAVVFGTQALPLAPTLEDAVDAVMDKAEQRGVAIRVEPFSEISVLHNRKWTTEVFVNLLENAIKYSGPGSCITISLVPLEFYSEIRVTDEGIGIREEDQTRIFQRFYRASDVQDREGAGIGLTLSRMILEHEKGYITVRSTYGQGSTFSVFLQNV